MSTLTLQEKFHRFLHEMDFKAQDQAANLYRFLILFVAIVSYLIAFYFQKFSICIYSILCASVFCLLVIVPGGLPWWKKPLPKFVRPKRE